ncbi:hypothetical protein [Mycobacterium deserti]|uniref:Uncharacterized protein n=1 Tax=Mycobacterium deserti TaxID=2978347 RepID=A0ABT2MBE7_9MYCO|nr:hypothetical protein [Mycobacterium deserti]MCT7659594.1 hypothetical protein [Mycobacterium deserti]
MTDTRPRSPGDGVGAVLLLFVHAGLALFLLFLNIGIAMSTDSCGYVECGNEDWILVAMFLGTWVNGAFLLFDIVIAIVFMAKRRRAVMVPAIGCAAHVALIGGAFAVASLAGPVSG